MGMVEDWYDEQEEQERRARERQGWDAQEQERLAEGRRFEIKMLLLLPVWLAAIAFFLWTELIGRRPFGDPDGSSPALRSAADFLYFFGALGTVVCGILLGLFGLAVAVACVWGRLRRH
jgi:hypothetical protein